MLRAALVQLDFASLLELPKDVSTNKLAHLWSKKGIIANQSGILSFCPESLSFLHERGMGVGSLDLSSALQLFTWTTVRSDFYTCR